MAHDSGSLDFKVINDDIKRVLRRRSSLNNTVQVAMPFVKATTTIQLPKLLGVGNIGFTIGVHALDQDVQTEDIYSSRYTNMPLVGYTYDAQGSSRRVYAIDPNLESTIKIFDKQASLFTNTNFVRVPPPGITNVNISRMKSGRVGSAQLTISVPSLVQLETLHRTFLIPGLGMIVEWGQQFAEEEGRRDVGEPFDLSTKLFPWYDRPKLDEMLRNLANAKYGLKNILEEYVYPSEGQYMWMFGRVANFAVKGNGDGSFECTVKIVGPAEDSWAYSTKNTIVPAKDPSSQYFCADNTNSVFSYFTETVSGFNFKSLLDTTLQSGNTWEKHVVKFKQDSTDQGKPTEANTAQSTTSQKTFADSEDAYFMSWRFFVNVVLNDENAGILGIFKKANLTSDEIKKIGLLRPYAHGEKREVVDIAGIKLIDDPLESFVGANKFLRSTDPSTLVIVNEDAVNLAISNSQYNRVTSAEKIFASSYESKKMLLGTGNFAKSATAYVTDASNPDKGFLSSGVWISHKAVIESMIQGKTIIDGIVNLLQRMNTATMGYWNLSLDTADGDVKDGLGHNYSIIDGNVRDSSDRAVDKFIDKVHVFNKYIRVSGDQGLVGSELIDCTVDLNLPKLLFSQIATLGLVHSEDLQSAGFSGSNALPSSPKFDPDDRLRKMFAITSLATNEDGISLADTEQGPDLTILPKKERAALIAANTCAATNTNTTAMTGGEGNRAGNVPIEDSYRDKSADELKAQQSGSQIELNKEECVMCKNCKGSAPMPAPTTPTTPPTTEPSSPSQTPSAFSAIFVTGITRDISQPAQIAAFKQGVGQDKRIFTAPYTNIQAVKTFLTQNPRTPVFLYSAGAGAANVTAMMNDPNVDKQKLFLIEPYFAGAATRAAAVDAVRNGLPASNIFAGPTSARGGGDKLIQGSSPVPAPNSHRTAPTYVGRAKASLLSPTRATTPVPTTPATPKPVSPATAPPAKGLKPINYEYGPHIPSDPDFRVGSEAKAPCLPSLANLPNAEYPMNNPSVLVSIGKAGTPGYAGQKGAQSDRFFQTYTWNGEAYHYLLAPEAAVQWKKLEAYARSQGVSFTVTSAYRNKEHQKSIAGSKAAKPGSSPHGTGCAIDISELYNANATLAKKLRPVDYDGRASASQLVNSEIRRTNALYRWLATYAPVFGWHFPYRLRDNNGAEKLNANGKRMMDECWHMEYWGYKYPPTNSPAGVVVGQDITLPPESTAPPPTVPPVVSSYTSVCTDEEYVKIAKGKSAADGKAICDTCKRHEQIVQQTSAVLPDKEKLEVYTREFAKYEKVFRYVEVFPDYMLSSITNDADGIRSNAFGASPGTLSISTDMVLPGINGLRVGELFWIDRMPAFYRAFGAFQIMNIEDTISISDGWKTKVHAVFNYMGEVWKARMSQRLSGTETGNGN